MNKLNKFGAAALTAALVLSMGAQALSAEVFAEEPVEEDSIGYVGDYVSVSDSTAVLDDAALKEKLAEVTLKVRNTLKIGDEYTSFNGDFSDNITNRVWYLNWSGENCSINVNAAEDGTVLRYNKYNYGGNSYYYGNNYEPKFQTIARADALDAAKSFLNFVLKDNESYELSENNGGPIRLSSTGSDSFYFNATITVNGIRTPLNVNVTVSGEDCTVTNFSRSDSWESYYGGFDEIDDTTGAQKAFELLKKNFTSDIAYYVYFDEDDIKFEHPKAALRYTFASTGDWFVDAETGKLIDRNTLYDDAYDNGLGGEIPAPTATMEEGVEMEAAAENKGYELTDVEKESISKLEGVLTSEELKKKLIEKYPEFGLDAFSVSSAAYNRNTETDEITARLTFTFRVTSASQIGMTTEGFKEYNDNKQALYIRKYVNVNAKTGELDYYYTNYPYFNVKYEATVTAKDTKAAAEAFLKKNFGDKFENTELTDEYSGAHLYTSYNYTRTANGYRLNSNYISVNVGKLTGNIDYYNITWTDGLEFDSADGIITADKAYDIYANAHEAILQYIMIPVALDDSKDDMIPYIEYGYKYVYSFLASYVLENVDGVYAVDAKTGELLGWNNEVEEEEFKYTDISGSKYKAMIEKLALYGATFGTTEFKPKQLVTERDFLIFVLNSVNYSFSETDMDEATLDWLYSEAEYYGFVEEGKRNPDSKVTREKAAKMIISATKYAVVTELEGIFDTGFSDESKISDDCLGSVAVAKALGLISADKSGKLGPNVAMTREALAALIYNYMDR